MKKYKTTIIAIIVIVVALVGFFVFNSLLSDRNNTTDVGEDDDSDYHYIISFATSKIKQIDTLNEGYLLTIGTKYDGSWECKTLDTLPIVQTNVSALFTTLRNTKGTIAYEGELTDKVKDLYKVTDEKTLKYTLDDDSVVTLSVGMNKPGASSYYVAVTGDPENPDRVYVITSTYLDALFFTKHDLISTAIFSFTDSGKIRYLKIQKSGEPFFEASADLSGEKRVWNATYPISRLGDYSHIESLINAATALVTDSHVASSPENLSQYGLDIPYYQLTIGDNKKEITMTLGNKTPDGLYYYCLISGIDDVLTISAESITFSDEAQVVLIDRYAYMINYTELTELKLYYGGQEYLLTYDITEETELLYFNGINTYIDENRDYRYDFKCIGTSLYGISITEIEPEPNHTDEVVIKVDYTLRDGTKVNVTGYKRDDYTFCTYVDGEYIGGYSNMRQLTGTKENYGLNGCIVDLKSLLGIKD